MSARQHRNISNARSSTADRTRAALAAVGYGDITPLTTTGRLCSLLMVACTFVLLPLQTSKLIELYSSRDPFAAAFSAKPGAGHIVVFGSVSAPMLAVLRAQLLKANGVGSCTGGSGASVLVVVSPRAPDADVRRALLEQQNPRWLY